MLICWLTDCPAAVRKFLEIDGVVNFLLTLVRTTFNVLLVSQVSENWDESVGRA